MRLGIAFVCMSACLLFSSHSVLAEPSFSKDLTQAQAVTKSPSFTVKRLVSGLDQPWSVAWLPNGDLLITERTGQLLRVASDFKSAPVAISGLPDTIAVDGQGGLLDVAVHPNHRENQFVYLSYSEGAQAGWLSESGTVLARARLNANTLSDFKVIFRMKPASRGGRHFGGRIVFARDGTVFLTLGDRGSEERAQKNNDHAGSVIRLHDDGRIPADNPFVSNKAYLPESFTRGNRNIQGAALHPVTGELWTHEHGPQGGDEINIIRPGRNYGWPTITYGVNYVTGTRIGEGVRKAGLEQPLHVWVPSIAPSGFAFYTGPHFPAWTNSLFLGALRGQALVRLELRDSKVIKEERLLVGEVGRVRDVRQGPDGYLYLLTESSDAGLLRIEPRP
ncbi:MAG: PQQ-dependent sugar dehydrogenase [Burkholderiaceae bacterium]|jgi:glucose/arabinose dehydrogenase